MHILFISHEGSRTGACLSLLMLAKYIKAQCDNITFDVLMLNGGPLESEFKEIADNIYHTLYHKENIIERAKNIARKVLRKGIPIPSFVTGKHYDLVYANTIMSLESAYHIYLNYRVPFILHVREMDYIIKGRYQTDEFIMMTNACNKIISISSAVTDNLTHNYQISQEKIVKIPTFSNHIKFEITPDCDVNKELCIDNNTFVIGMAGNMDWRKGCDLIPILVKKISIIDPNFNYKIVWVGRDNGEIRKIKYDLNQMGMSDKVIFTGEQKNPTRFYQRNDIFIMISREEPLGLVSMENAALGKPLICFNSVTGTIDIIKNDAGYVVPYLDLDTMAERIYHLYSNSDLREQMGKTAQKRIKEEFSPEISLNKIINEIKKIFNQ